MNYYFKIIIGLFCCLLLKPGYALDLQGLYSTSCSRDIGVILGVDRNKVYLLNLQGNVIAVPRYDIVGIASYPINHIPISTFELPENLSGDINYYQIKTLFNKKLVDLVEGWPIGFSRDQIAFLDKDGREIAVQRTDIWSIDVLPSMQKRMFSEKVRYKYDFLHPASMAKCPKQLQGNLVETTKQIDIVPQEFISDPVTIKRKFDEIQAQHEIVQMYVRSEKFYAVPQVYKNLVTLGFWGTLGSRYGSSETRTNNGAPILVDELSTGPFGYQHIILTGAAPNGLLLHEEPQTQLFYRLKADYFHASFFFDPNLILVGGKYDWQEKDIHNGEFRAVEPFLLEAGLDFGHFSLIYVPTSTVYVGAKVADSNNGNFDFETEILEFDKRFGIGFHNYVFKADMVYGQKTDEFSDSEQINFNESTGNFEVVTMPVKEYQLIFLRLNSEFEFLNKYRMSNSLIGKRLRVGSLVAKSYTVATYLDYKLNYKYLVRGMLGYERVSSNQRDTSQYLKVGLNFSIIF